MKNVRGYEVFLFFFVPTDAAHSSRYRVHPARFQLCFSFTRPAGEIPSSERRGRSTSPHLSSLVQAVLSFVSSSLHESVPTSMMTYSGIHDDNRKLKALRLRPGRKTSMTTSDPHPVNQLWESKPAYTCGPLQNIS